MFIERILVSKLTFLKEIAAFGNGARVKAERSCDKPHYLKVDPDVYTIYRRFISDVIQSTDQ